MTILKELWTNQKVNPETKLTYQYVFDLRNRLEDTALIAHQNLSSKAAVHKHYYEKKGKKEKLQAWRQSFTLASYKPK